MDLIATLRKKIEVLDDGEYIPGLKAVLMHIEAAFRHLLRGQDTDDDTAFTDAIYRTNQAFEGSIKEAYRVLAGKDPFNKRPFDIENYLEQQNTFRSRVLNQLTTYRTEWRNPSVHNYKLDFDESESFLAIVSVSAFACLLLDQIAERLAFNKSQAEADASKPALNAHPETASVADLLSRVTDLLTQFCAAHLPTSGSSGKQTYVQIIGALHGFITSVAPELTVETEAIINSERRLRADLLISREEEKVVIELKRQMIQKNYQNALVQVETDLLISGITSGVLLFLPSEPSEMKRVEVNVSSDGGRLVVLSPPTVNKDASR